MLALRSGKAAAEQRAAARGTRLNALLCPPKMEGEGRGGGRSRPCMAVQYGPHGEWAGSAAR